MRRSKYGAIKTTVDGFVFDSKAEASRYGALKLLERAGEIEGLQRQQTIQLVPGVKFHDAKRATPAVRFVADFAYFEWAGDRRVRVIEDVKGVQTPSFKLKRHLLKALFNIDVRITK